MRRLTVTMSSSHQRRKLNDCGVFILVSNAIKWYVFKVQGVSKVIFSYSFKASFTYLITVIKSKEKTNCSQSSVNSKSYVIRSLDQNNTDEKYVLLFSSSSCECQWSDKKQYFVRWIKVTLHEQDRIYSTD